MAAPPGRAADGAALQFSTTALAGQGTAAARPGAAKALLMPGAAAFRAVMSSQRTMLLPANATPQARAVAGTVAGAGMRCVPRAPASPGPAAVVLAAMPGMRCVPRAPAAPGPTAVVPAAMPGMRGVASHGSSVQPELPTPAGITAPSAPARGVPSAPADGERWSLRPASSSPLRSSSP